MSAYRKLLIQIPGIQTSQRGSRGLWGDPSAPVGSLPLGSELLALLYHGPQQRAQLLYSSLGNNSRNYSLITTAELFLPCAVSSLGLAGQGCLQALLGPVIPQPSLALWGSQSFHCGFMSTEQGQFSLRIVRNGEILASILSRSSYFLISQAPLS